MVPIEESFGFNRTTLCVVMICATGIFVWHSSTILGRYLVNSVSESVFSVRNVSLILPVVNMQLERQRRAPIPNDTVLHRMGFRALIDDKKVPDWASPVRHDHTPSKAMEVGLHSITVNRVSLEDLEKINYTLDDLRTKELWPLRTRRAGGGGYKIYGRLNATNYLEEGTIDVDTITVVISSPYSDSASTAAKIAFFRLFPCERLTVVLQYEERNLLNRPDSPCRDDYPEDFAKSVFREPALKIGDFYNPIHYPKLPYDKQTCEHLCVSRFWARKCNCFMYMELRKYSGAPANWKVCGTIDDEDNCTLSDAHYQTPADVIQSCQCYDKCTDVKFNVVGQQTNRYSIGSKFCPNASETLTIVEIYYSDLSYRVITEEETYPIKEMINEWAGILGLYFGFSFFSIVAVIKGSIVTYRKKAEIKKRIMKKVIEAWKTPNEKEKSKTDAENGTVQTKYMNHWKMSKKSKSDNANGILQDVQQQLQLLQGRVTELETENISLRQMVNVK